MFISIPCSIDGCLKPGTRRTWCDKHYWRWSHYGRPDYPVQQHTYHGLKKAQPREYAKWRAIRQRTQNPKNKAFARYGGRGITMCKGWDKSARSFIEDIGSKPGPGYSLDRINGTGNYSCGHCEECIKNEWPANCRWATQQQQVWNRGKQIVNTSGYIGIQLLPSKRYFAQIVDTTGRNFTLGTFEDIEQAALAYDIAAIFFRGDFAITNLL